MRRIRFDKMIWKKAGNVLVLAWLLLLSSALAQSGGDYVLEWSTIDGGGGASSGGPYILTGTTGQPDAEYSRGGNYELLGGFWPGGLFCFVDFKDFARFADPWLFYLPITNRTRPFCRFAPG